jgi:hypothetical protein
MAPEVQKALNAVAGEVGAKTLKEAVNKHAGGKGVARLREIRADIRKEMGGVIVKGPKADELKKRLQAEGLLPEGKAKTVAPGPSPLVLNWAPKELDGPTNRDLKKEYDKLDKEQKGLQKELDALVKERDKTKPDALYGAWETGDLKKFRDGMEKRDPKKFEEAIKRVDGELARRELPVIRSVPSDMKREPEALAAKDPQASAKKGRTTLENEDLSRIMRGEEPLNMKIVSDAGELGMGALRQKSQIAQLQSVLGLGTQTRQEVGRDLEGLRDEAQALQSNLKQQIRNAKPNSKKRSDLIRRLKEVDEALAAQTNASDRTQFARENARDTDERIKRNGITQQEGEKGYDWDSSTGKGAKKLGSGAFGTVIEEPGKGNAVKRGDVGENEAQLIGRIGKVDLGPKLKAAELDGDTGRPGTKLGRVAMTVVPGEPIGYKKADDVVGGVKVADAYWTARANLHRMGIAHNDMHIDNVFIDNKGKGRFVDMGLAQGSSKAALAEAMGVFQPPKGSSVTRVMGAAGQGDWQTRRWDGTAGKLLETYESRLKDGLMPALTEKARKELEEKAPVLAKIQQNKADVQFAMKRDGFTNDDIASVMDHGIRSPLDTYNQGAWSRISDDQARKYIDILYDGI